MLNERRGRRSEVRGRSGFNILTIKKVEVYMDKDRTEICKIISGMLDNPDEHGIYPTGVAYTELEKYVEGERNQAIGWMYAYACILLDNGTGKPEGTAEDLRNILVPEILEQAKKDLDVKI